VGLAGITARQSTTKGNPDFTTKRTKDTKKTFSRKAAKPAGESDPGRQEKLFPNFASGRENIRIRSAGKFA